MVAVNQDAPTTLSAAVGSNPVALVKSVTRSNFGTFAELAEKKKAEKPKWAGYVPANYTPYQSGYKWRGNGWVSEERAAEMDAIAKQAEEALACAWSPATDLPPVGSEECETCNPGDCGIEVEDVPTSAMLDAMQDEVVGQVKLYVADIQSAAYHFERNPDANTIDNLLGCVDGLSGFILNITEGK